VDQNDQIELDVMEFIDGLDRLSSLDQLIPAFETLIAKYGYGYFRCAEIVRVNEPIDPKNAFGKLNKDWSIHYRGQEYVFHDSTVQMALKTKYPFTWSALQGNKRINSIAKRMFDEAKYDFDHSDGIVVPIHMSNGSVSVFSVIGKEPNTQPNVVRAIGLAAVYLHSKAQPFILEDSDIASPSFKSPISKRQLDCLQWVAEGKTDWEISQILGISEATVHNHVEAAKRSLSVRTRMQAVVEASRRRLIIL